MAGEAAGPAPSWLRGQEVLTLSLQSDPALAGGRRMPRCSPESLPAAPWLGWQKGLLFNGLVFGDEAHGIPIPRPEMAPWSRTRSLFAVGEGGRSRREGGEWEGRGEEASEAGDKVPPAGVAPAVPVFLQSLGVSLTSLPWAARLGPTQSVSPKRVPEPLCQANGQLKLCFLSFTCGQRG